MKRRISVLFVCLGNICRSPLAEGVFIELARERGVLDRLRIDSAGTGAWHVGKRADPRSIAVARKHGIELPSVARQIDPRADFVHPDDPDAPGFDWLIAMDRSNAARMLSLGASRQRVRLLRSFDRSLAGVPADSPDLEVPDPYYGGESGFDDSYSMIRRACEGLLDALLAGDGASAA
jgi:protein-tyrosine phosphatase